MSRMAAAIVLLFSFSSAAGISGEDNRFGVPTFYWARSADHVTPPGLTPEQAARRHLEAHAERYRTTVAQLAAARVTGIHDLHDGTAVIVIFQQRIGGVRVFLDEVKVVMNPQLELVAISGFLTPAIEPLGPFSLRAESSVESAYRHFTGRNLAPDALTSGGLTEGGYTQWQVEGARSVRTRPVYFPMPAGLAPAFYGELEVERGWFSFVVSAIDGAVLFEKNLTATHDFKVWADPITLVPYPGPHGPDSIPHPSAAPTGFIPTPVGQQLVTLEHAGLSTGDPWLLPGATDTRGNNVSAYADLDSPNGLNLSTDLLGTTSSPGAFSWVYDLAASPSGSPQQIRASVVQLFYTTNFLHDWFYDDGFTESSANAQLYNLGRGGLGSDVLLAEAQDYSGLYNANMSTPADGRSPRMQMYLFSNWFFGRPNRDGTIDNGIVAHEWGHYISNRLIGDSNGLSTQQSYGMGEGWGDFHSALLIVDRADAVAPGNANWKGAFSLSGWASESIDVNGYYYGIRRYPLSTDFSRNPLTFGHIADGVPLPTGVPTSRNFESNSEVHNTGEIWALMLWECYAELLRDPRYTFEQAQGRMKRYLVAAYKATPMAPTFTEGRDALLAVAVASDATDFVHFLQAFARRGLGRGAIAPDRYGIHNNFPFAESFSVGNEVQFVSFGLDDSSQSCDGDGVLDRGEVGVFTTTLRNLGTAALSGTTLTVSSANANVRFPSGTSWPVPTMAAFATTTLDIPVVLAGGTDIQLTTLDVSVTGAALGPTPTTAAASFRMNSDSRPTNSPNDSVEAVSTNWTTGADAQLDTGSGFRRTEATPAQHFWFAPSPATTADSWLISPRLEVGSAPFVVMFNHRHDFEILGADWLDGAVIELSTDDGLTWVDVGSRVSGGYGGVVSTLNNSNPLAGRNAFVGRSRNYPAFLTHSLDFGLSYANSTVRLRFRMGGNAGSESPTRGWELDDFRFRGLTNNPFDSLVPDPNVCSNRPPVATTEANTKADEQVRVVLVGMGSDPDGEQVTLSWAQTGGPLGVLNGSSFITPEVSVDTIVTLELTAHDGRASSAPAVQRMLVKNVNRAPRANAPMFAEGNAGEEITVHGTGSDPDGDALTFEWSQVSGPTVALEGTQTDTVRLVLPDEGDVKLGLVVRDGSAASEQVTTTITVHARVEEVAMPEKPAGCGCSTADVGLMALGALAFLRRRSWRLNR